MTSQFEGEVWVGDRGCRVTVGMSDVRQTKLLMGGAKSEANDKSAQSPLLEKALDQVGEYLSGNRKNFDLPLWISGAPFYHRVWDALREVPYGRTVTYGELAKMVGNEKAHRAVGGAMRSNPLVLVVPCHRVVAFGGKLGGFSCGVEWKKWLLNLELGGATTGVTASTDAGAATGVTASTDAGAATGGRPYSRQQGLLDAN